MCIEEVDSLARLYLQKYISFVCLRNIILKNASKKRYLTIMFLRLLFELSAGGAQYHLVYKRCFVWYLAIVN